jgi:2-pyrone-4,6-dicarboxylate lactonase
MSTRPRHHPAAASQPQPPGVRLPAGACDAHCHVFGPGDVLPVFGQAHLHAARCAGRSLRALHAMLGIERVVLVQASVHGQDNSAMLDAIAQSPDSYRGVAMVAPRHQRRRAEGTARGGVRSVRFNFVQHLGGAPDLPVGAAHGRAHQAAGLAPGAAPGCGRPGHLPRVPLGLPVPFAIDHMGRTMVKNGLGQQAFAMLLDLLRTNEKAWVKVSGAERISDALSAAQGRPVCGRRAVRAQADRSRARPRAVGHRLAAPQRARDARRRQAGGPAAAFCDDAACCASCWWTTPRACTGTTERPAPRRALPPTPTSRRGAAMACGAVRAIFQKNQRGDKP